MVVAIVTGIVDIVNALWVAGWLFLFTITIAICFFLLYFLEFSEEQRNKTNEHIIKVIERLTKEKEKPKWRY